MVMTREDTIRGEQESVSGLVAALKEAHERETGLEERLRETLIQAERSNRQWYRSKFAITATQGLLKIGAIYVFFWACYTFFQPQIDKAIDNIPAISTNITQTMSEWNKLSEGRLKLDELKIKEGYVVEQTSIDHAYGKPVTRIEKVGPASRSQ